MILRNKSIKNWINHRHRTLIKMRKYYNDLENEIERHEKKIQFHEESLAIDLFDKYIQSLREISKKERISMRETQKREQFEREEEKRNARALYPFIFQINNIFFFHSKLP
jgi:hypothetical protein